MKVDYRLTAITVLLVGVLYLAIDFNSKLNHFNQNYLNTIKNIYKIDNHWKKYLDILKESLISGNFNNDILVEHMKSSDKENKKLLEDSTIQNNYPLVYKSLLKYSKQRNQLKNLTNKFLMTNAKVKNSISILNKELTKLDINKQEYFQNYVKTLTEFMNVKNSFELESSFSQELMEYFEKNKDTNKLYYIHIKLLYTEIPKLHILFNKIKNNELPIIIEDTFKIAEVEAEKQKQTMENKFYIIMGAYIIFFIVILMLVRDVKEHIEQLRVKDKFLYEQSKMASMGEMIDAIAHQWKQPISLIRLGTDFLSYQMSENKLDKKDLEEYQKKVYIQIDHMTNTLNEFRTFLRPNKEKKEFDIEKSIRSVLLLVKDEFISNNIDVELIVNKHLQFKGIENEFKHVVLNILNNAKDAFVENKIKEKQIVITLDEKANKNSISILDNAGGIPKNVIEHIFEANFTTKAEGVGTGIGLYMSKQIIEKAQGLLEVKNQNNGACFIITL